MCHGHEPASVVHLQLRGNGKLVAARQADGAGELAAALHKGGCPRRGKRWRATDAIGSVCCLLGYGKHVRCSSRREALNAV